MQLASVVSLALFFFAQIALARPAKATATDSDAATTTAAPAAATTAAPNFSTVFTKSKGDATQTVSVGVDGDTDGIDISKLLGDINNDGLFGDIGADLGAGF